MKPLFLILVFALQQGPGMEGLTGPFVGSDSVVLYDSSQEEQSQYPNLITAQSVRAANGVYFLRIVISSRSWLGDPCEVNLVVDRKELTMPCFKQRSIEVIPGYSGRLSGITSYITQHLVVRSEKMKSVLMAKSVELRVGGFEFELRNYQLKELSSVVAAPARKPVGKSARF